MACVTRRLIAVMAALALSVTGGAVASRSVIPTYRMRPFLGAVSSPFQSECRTLI